MTRLPRVRARELIRGLERIGFYVDRTRGSHVVVKHADGRMTAIPTHSGETLGVGLLRAILRDLEITAEDLVEILS